LIAGFVAALLAYAWVVILFTVAPVDLIVVTNDALVKWAVKVNTTSTTAMGSDKQVIVTTVVDYRFGSRVVLGAWLATLHVVAFLKGDR